MNTKERCKEQQRLELPAETSNKRQKLDHFEAKNQLVDIDKMLLDASQGSAHFTRNYAKKIFEYSKNFEKL